MNEYPVTFAVEYPERSLDRLTSFFRIFTVIPIAILLSTITGYSTTYEGVGDTTVTIAVSGVGLLVIPVLLMILFREKYPRWWFDWNLQLQSFVNRIGVYALLMDDRYPATDEEQGVRLELLLSRRRDRPRPRHAAGQVVPRDPALRRPVLPEHRRLLRRRSPPGSRSSSPVATRAGSSTTSRE